MILFFDETGVLTPGAVKELKIVLKQVCSDYGRAVKYINVVFVNDEALLEMNRKHLAHDYYTDILSFNYAEDPGVEIEGELYISLDRVADNARILGIAAGEELKRVAIHGALHLCGLNDETGEEKHTMQQAENKYLGINVPRGT